VCQQNTPVHVNEVEEHHASDKDEMLFITWNLSWASSTKGALNTAREGEGRCTLHAECVPTSGSPDLPHSLKPPPLGFARLAVHIA
jgi:hypothetical protein